MGFMKPKQSGEQRRLAAEQAALAEKQQQQIEEQNARLEEQEEQAKTEAERQRMQRVKGLAAIRSKARGRSSLIRTGSELGANGTLG